MLVHFHRSAAECGKTATVAPQTHFFCLARKSGQKEALGDGAGCTAVPQKYPVEEHCGQHTRISLQNWTTAPPAWRQRSHRKQLPRKGMAKHTAVECRTHLRVRRWCSIFVRADRVACPYRVRSRIAAGGTVAVLLHLRAAPVNTGKTSLPRDAGGWSFIAGILQGFSPPPLRRSGPASEASAAARPRCGRWPPHG